MWLDTVGYSVPLNIYKPEWMTDAECLSAPIELFFPERPDAYKAIQKARKICDGCPVRLPCLEYALETGSVGIWAGTGPRERATILWNRATAV